MAELIPPRRSNVIYISDNSDGSSARAHLLALQEQVGSGDFLTSDDTGFTVDSIKLNVDMTEA